MIDVHSKNEMIRAEILKAAEELFQKWGLNKTTMEDIAKQAGKGKSTLYYYFKSKEEIFEAVVMKEAFEVSRILHEAIESATTAAEKLQTFAQVGLEEMKKRITCYEIVRQEIRDMNDLIKKIRGRIDARDVGVMKNILIYGIRNGEFMLFNEDEINLLSALIVNGIRSLEMDLVLSDKYVDQKIRIDFLTNILIKGLKK
jgi:AcrR family transcriptional regulator